MKNMVLHTFFPITELLTHMLYTLSGLRRNRCRWNWKKTRLHYCPDCFQTVTFAMQIALEDQIEDMVEDMEDREADWEAHELYLTTVTRESQIIVLSESEESISVIAHGGLTTLCGSFYLRTVRCAGRGRTAAPQRIMGHGCAYLRGTNCVQSPSLNYQLIRSLGFNVCSGSQKKEAELNEKVERSENQLLLLTAKMKDACKVCTDVSIQKMHVLLVTMRKVPFWEERSLWLKVEISIIHSRSTTKRPRLHVDDVASFVI